MKLAPLLCTLISPVIALAQINEGNLITKNKYFEIPYSDTKVEIRARASVRGNASDFMLDSGAPTFISTDMQDKYHFQVLRKVKVGDAGGKSVFSEIVRIDTLRFGPFILTGIPALVLDLDNSPLKCFGLDGNVGSNVFRHLVLQFDVRHGVIALTDNKALIKNSVNAWKPMFVNQQSDAYFSMKVDDGLTDTVHFDTGDGKLYEMSKRKTAIYTALYPNDVIRTGYGVVSIGVGGIGKSFDQYIMKPGSLKVGNDTISGGLIYIAGNDKSRMGRELLNYGILTLDYPDSSYSFEKYPEHYNPMAFDYGISYVPDGTKLFAGCVWKNTPAEREGIESGDEIIKINDTDLTQLTDCGIDNLVDGLKHQSRDSLSFTFRKGRRKIKTVTLPKLPL